MLASSSADIQSPGALHYIIRATYGVQVWKVCETYMSMVENTSHAGQILILHNCHESERAEFATTMVGLLHIATYRIA